MKGLIVDDEYFARKGMRLTIPWEKYGIEICAEADCMESAIEILAETEIEIVFTDLTMPNGSGFELLKYTKEKYPHIYMVVVTCHRDFDMIQKAFRMGAIDYIVKTELEEGVFEKSLERIAHHVVKEEEKKHRHEKGEIYGDVMDEETRIKFTMAWSDMMWIYDEKWYAKLCQKTKNAKLTRELHKMIFYEVLEEMDVCIGLGKIPEKAENLFLEACSWKEYKEVLEEIRSYIKQKFSLKKYPKDTVVLVLNILEYVKKNVHQDINQEEVARTFNISRSYFSRVFKGIFGINYADYCRNYKIWIAKKLLRETELPMYQIAEKVGFTDERYFSRIFREMTGMKPSEYRKSTKENLHVSD